MTKYFIDASGDYVGGFDGCDMPEGLVEVKSPPNHGSDKWNGAYWVPNSIQLAKSEILRLEVQITPRRLREAILGVDGGWLANQEQLISDQRSIISQG